MFRMLNPGVIGFGRFPLSNEDDATISLSITPESGWVDSATYTTFAGTATHTGNATITDVEWKLESGGTYAAVDSFTPATGAWSVTSIALSEGANEIFVRATDSDAKTKEKSITISVDTVDPVVTLPANYTHDGTGTTFTLDYSEMVTEVNPYLVEYQVNGGGYTPWAAPYDDVSIPITGETDYTIDLRVTDLAGRQGSDQVVISYASVFEFTKAANPDTSVTIRTSVPAGKEIVIDWGDETSTTVTGPVTNNDSVHAYGDANQYSGTISGDLDSVTKFQCTNEPMVFTTAHLAKFTACTYMSVYSTQSSGNLSDVSGLPLTHLLASYSNVSVCICDLAPITTLTFLDVSETTGSYTSTTLPAEWDNCDFYLTSMGLSESEVNAFLQDMDTMSTSSSKTISMAGTNAAPTGAGLTAKASLISKGWTVTTTV